MEEALAVFKDTDLQKLKAYASQAARQSYESFSEQLWQNNGASLEEKEELLAQHSETCKQAGFVVSIANAQHFYERGQFLQARGWLAQARGQGKEGKVENYSHYIKTLRTHYNDYVPILKNQARMLTCPVEENNNQNPRSLL